ncbi:hypothetical protein BJ912DRAFT_1006415 [Pholiota molesta]|nr:hypothetical protein BJ912DRAFT_1006415 [Pholiota molesta]
MRIRRMRLPLLLPVLGMVTPTPLWCRLLRLRWILCRSEDAANAAGPDPPAQRAIAQVLEVLHMARSQPEYLQTYEFLLPS